MENLRWILILAGVAILVLLYLSGRQSSSTRRSGEQDALNPDSKTSSSDAADPLMGDDSFASAPIENFADESQLDDPLERPGGSRITRKPSLTDRGASGLGLGGIGSKLESFGKSLGSNRRGGSSDAQAKKPAKAKAPSKIVTLHVVAPEGQLMNGGHLLDQFEQRGYHYGDMNIFHSMHEGKTVFSIAKLVMPGTFDINDIDSFQTPGISLILQLPGPVPADVAFEVLLSESHEIASALGATVLDADRSTLSKQTVQHMREGINEYMHKQKYFSKEPS